MSHDAHAEVHYHSHASQYAKILAILMVLTIITVAASRIDFGWMNIAIAMVIASIKAGLVAMFFMHLKYENPLTWLYAAFPLVLLFLLIGMLFLDNGYRTGPDGEWAPKEQTML
jgi:cytochrome c oxidase subunit 4